MVEGKGKGARIALRSHAERWAKGWGKGSDEGKGAGSGDDQAAVESVEAAGTAPKNGAGAVPLSPRKNGAAPVRPKAAAEYFPVTPKAKPKAKALALPPEGAASVGPKKLLPEKAKELQIVVLQVNELPVEPRR